MRPSRELTLWLIGLVLSLALYHASFGFASAYRRMIVARDMRGVWAQLLLLGYGSRIAYGCNMGALVSGVASGSLHGWLWIASALPGFWLGMHLRRRFGMAD